MTPPPAWHAEARAMHASGVPRKQIAAHFKRSHDHVQRVITGAGRLDELARRRQVRARQRARKAAEARAAGEQTRNEPHKVFAAHVPRAATRIIPPADTIMALAVRFAKGKISRAQLSKGLRSSTTQPGVSQC